jgi:dTDP-4-dehydrorhamnose reductase
MITTKAVLIIGGSGFVGTHLALRLREGYKVFATYHTRRTFIPGVTFIPFNVENRNWVKRVVYTAQPDVIIYCAGANNTLWAEKEPRKAEHVHTGGAATVSNVSDILQPKFIYLSNCYTFDGGRGNYHESDTLSPLTALGKAKVGGENFIRGKALNYVIVRSSPLLGRSNGMSASFLDNLRITLDRGQSLELQTHEQHSFALVDGFVDLIIRLIETGVRNKIVHYGGLTKTNYGELARTFAKRFKYDPSLILPPRSPPKIGGEDLILDYSLNSTHAVEMLKIKPLLLEESFDLIEKLLVPRL